MANDVEIKLNIAAEYKAAMTAIAQLSVALKKLQEQSKLVVGAGNKGPTSAVTISPELQKALEGQKNALQAAAAEMSKTQAALQALVNTSASGADQLRAVAESIAKIQQPSGNDDALQAMADKLGEAMEEIARLQQAIEQLEAARETVAKNDQRRSAQADKLTAADIRRHDQAMLRMQFEGLTRQQLAKKIQELMKLREEAAKQNDRDAWEAYNAQIIAANQSMEQVNRNLTMNRIGMQQQAQTGFMVANTMSQFASAIRTGNINLADMVNQVMAVSQAIKAGLGPIGWAMIAVQGLQLVWDKLREAQAKEEAQARRAREQIISQTKEIASLEKKVSDLERNIANRTFADNLKEELSTVKSILDANQKLTAERSRQASLLRQEIEDRKQAQMFELEMQELNLRNRFDSGAIDADTYKAGLRRIRDARTGIDADAARELLVRHQEDATNERDAVMLALNTARDQAGMLTQRLGGRTVAGEQTRRARRASAQKSIITERTRLKAVQREIEELQREYDSVDEGGEGDALRSVIRGKIDERRRDEARYAEQVKLLEQVLDETSGPSIDLARLEAMTKSLEDVQRTIEGLETKLAKAEEGAQDASAAVARHERQTLIRQQQQAQRDALQDDADRIRKDKEEQAKYAQSNAAIRADLGRLTSEELNAEIKTSAAEAKGSTGNRAAYYTRRLAQARSEKEHRARSAAFDNALREYDGPKSAAQAVQGLRGLMRGNGGISDSGLTSLFRTVDQALKTQTRKDDEIVRLALEYVAKSAAVTEGQAKEIRKKMRKLTKWDS